ncbi:acyltransferase family protein [Pedobacter paludis]|uniref:Acyltransferase 3 domain-containing protein n=1 Tax=Pedobacter paludis TaxID=2203212 RepID=A0A317F746_9SPHI|nr:acyltransferase [Pedobacter paludis]PWS33759.1 hypothetical protein DF947_03880 [Pedobacter paludis]
MNQKRIYQIDLFRFLAALAVMIFHYTFRGFYSGKLSIIDYPSISWLTKYLYLGVDLFFIISGFVIFMSMKNSTLPKFIVSRISRIYPAFWVAVTFTSLVILFSKDPKFIISTKQYFANLTLFNSAVGIENIDGVYWSLIIELKFYFLMGILLLLNGMDKIKILMISWLLLSFIMYFTGSNILITKILKTIFFPQYSSYFIAGMIFYLVYDKGNSIVYFIMLFFCYVLSVLTSLERIVDFSHDFNSPFNPTIIILSITAFYLLMLGVSIGKLQFLNRKNFVVLGAITYPLYLIHQNIGFIIINKINYSMNKYLLLISLTLGMLIVAYMMQKYIEKPFAKWLKKILSKNIEPKKSALSSLADNTMMNSKS